MPTTMAYATVVLTATLEPSGERFTWNGLDVTRGLTPEQRSKAQEQIAVDGYAELDVELECEASVLRGCRATRIDPAEPDAVEDLLALLGTVDVRDALGAREIEAIEEALLEREREDPRN